MVRRHIEGFDSALVAVTPVAVNRGIGRAAALVLAFVFAQARQQQLLPTLLFVGVFHYLRHQLRQGTGVLPVLAVKADFVFLADAAEKNLARDLLGRKWAVCPRALAHVPLLTLHRLR
jgi:hypothetical protein